MPPVVIELRKVDDPRDGVHRVVQALAEGKLVALPTETVYGLAASALNESAVARLRQVKQRQANQPLALAIKSADEAIDFVPDMSPLARRLARRCWPGPLTLVVQDDHVDSLVHQLPKEVHQAVSPQGTLGLRVPGNEVTLSVLRLLAGPLVLTSANRSGQAEAVTAQAVVQALGDDVDFVLDDGRCKFGQPSTVVRVEPKSLQVLREGVFSDAALRRLSGFIVLFVCTGNTCRSPMAEALAKKRIADKLQCKIEELEDRGVIVVSAGIAAMAGGRATPAAVEVTRQRKLDLTQHVSQPLNERLVRHADLILTLTRGHRDAIVAQWPEVAERTALLCRDCTDVGDPIGGSEEMYRRCADQIDEQLAAWVEEIDFNIFEPDEPRQP